MADLTHIEWTDATWNPITGCSIVSPGCTNCYAMKLAGTRLQHHPSRAGLTKDTKAGPVWSGEVRFNEKWLDRPLKWKRPRRIFVCAHGDLFAENVPDEWIDRVFAVMALADQHTFQVLTKRSGRMRAYVTGVTRWTKIAQWIFELTRQSMSVPVEFRFDDDQLRSRIPLPNVWLGVSAEDQTRADERIPDLLETPAAVRFVSAEPLLGPIDFTSISPDGDSELDSLRPMMWQEIWDSQWSPESTGVSADEALESFLDWYSLAAMPQGLAHPALDWIIVGGESGPGARPMHPAWVRSIRDQCAAASTAFFFKQWGEWDPWSPSAETWLFPNGGTRAVRNAEDWPDDAIPIASVGKKAAGRLLDGIEHNAMPEAQL